MNEVVKGRAGMQLTVGGGGKSHVAMPGTGGSNSVFDRILAQGLSPAEKAAMAMVAAHNIAANKPGLVGVQIPPRADQDTWMAVADDLGVNPVLTGVVTTSDGQKIHTHRLASAASATVAVTGSTALSMLERNAAPLQLSAQSTRSV